MGEVFAGRYELIDPIGEGGMGTVWRVRDLRAGRVLAAKVMRQSHSSALLRFVREQALRVDHPHVVVPIGWAGEDDQVLFTMEIVDGGNVATLVGDFGAIPPLFTAEVMRQILDALTAVHEARLVHRDIKPANILLDATGTGRPHAYLSDFGIAVDLDGPRFTETGFITGTPGYLAPELSAFGDPTPGADAYAIGMVAAHMLTGLPPAQALAGGPPPGVPASLWAVVVGLTRHEPTERLSIAEAIARLDVPELAWSEAGIGEIEVFSQVPPLDSEPEATRILPAEHGSRTVPEPSITVGTSEDQTVPDRDRSDAVAETVVSGRAAGETVGVGRADAATRDGELRSGAVGRSGMRDVVVYGLFAALVVAGLLLMLLG